MQFNFDCEEALDCDRNGFAILDGSCQNRIIPGYRFYVKEIIDTMGQLSANAQQLESAVTSTSRFFPSYDTLIIKADKNRVLGFIKVGTKNLFLRDLFFNYHESNTLCVLDFYVHESVQRKGVGKMIFDYMLNYENKHPASLAYDRPTLRLLSFMKKNYGLKDYMTQNNSFMIYEQFFNQDGYPNNDTEFDNETFRVIQNLKTPQFINRYKYSTNNFRKYMSNHSVRLNNVQSPYPRIHYDKYLYNKNHRKYNLRNNDNYNDYNRDSNYRINYNDDNNIENNYRNNNNDNNNNNIENNYRNNENLNRSYDGNYNGNSYRNNDNYENNNSYRNRNNDNNIYINNYINNNNNINENIKNFPKSVSQKKKILFTNDFTNKVINKEVYKNPSKGFQKYYLNKEDSLAYDNIYSKQKMNLINDYMASKKQTPDEFIEEQNNINQNSIQNSNLRLNELNDKISDIKGNNRYQPEQLFVKRFNYATLFDDKKIAENEYNQQNQNLHRSLDFINEPQYQNYQKNQMINERRYPMSPRNYSPYIQNENNYNDNPLSKSTHLYRNSSCENPNDEYNNYNENNDNDIRRQSPNRRYY